MRMLVVLAIVRGPTIANTKGPSHQSFTAQRNGRPYCMLYDTHEHAAEPCVSPPLPLTSTVSFCGPRHISAELQRAGWRPANDETAYDTPLAMLRFRGRDTTAQTGPR